MNQKVRAYCHRVKVCDEKGESGWGFRTGARGGKQREL